MAQWGIKPAVPMSEEQFRLWQTLVESRTGILLQPTRKLFLETCVTTRMRELGMEDYDNYYERLMAGSPGSSEWVALTDKLAVQETSFFRHPSSYHLVESVLRQLLLNPAKKNVSIWSVGCSTGEEPYSLAILMENVIAGTGRKDIFYGITATDISYPALAKARAGIYPERKLSTVAELSRTRYFTAVPGGREWQVNEGLRRRVAFGQLNLMEVHKAPFTGLDVIFCQNVLIYFRRFKKRDIVNELADRLTPGGILVLGPGEVVDWSHPGLERIEAPDTLAFRSKPAELSARY